MLGPSPFMGEVREAMRVRHYSIRTELAYWDWIRRFILFHDKRHPREMGEQEIAAATQNQALNALVFLYMWGLVGLRTTTPEPDT